MSSFLFLFVQRLARSFSFSSQVHPGLMAVLAPFPTSWGTTQAVLAGATCRPFFRQDPSTQCSPGSKTILTFLKHFYFTPPVGLPCVQDWVKPEKRASL